MLKINPGKSTVWLRPDTIQIGLEADAVIVGGLSPAHQRFIRALQSGIADNQLGVIARTSRIGITEAERLIDRLAGAMLENSQTAVGSGKPQAPLVALRDVNPDFSELIRIALQTNSNGNAVVAHRANRLLHIETLDKTGVTLIRGLANAGFAQFWSGDSAGVSDADVQALGYSTEQLGFSRVDAIKEIAAGFANNVVIVAFNGQRLRTIERVDLAILIAHQAIDPRRYKKLMKFGVPHIAITYNELGVRVSPIVVPNKTQCLGCHDKAMNAVDPLHAVRMTQLAHASQRYDDSSAVLFSAAMVVAAATEFLDSQQGFAHQQFERLGWQFERATGRVFRIDWPALPTCNCFAREAEAGADLEGLDFESAQESRRA